MINSVTAVSNSSNNVTSPARQEKGGHGAIATGAAGLAASQTIRVGSKVYYSAQNGIRMINNGAKGNTKKLMLILDNLAKKTPKLAKFFKSPIVRTGATVIGAFSGLTFAVGSLKSIGNMINNISGLNNSNEG